MREILFGSRELTAYYRNSLALIHQYQLYRPYQLETNETEAVLVLFNCFRYRRNFVSGKYSVEYLDLSSGRWKKDRIIRRLSGRFKFSRCPDISCLTSKKWLLFVAMENMLKQVKAIVDRQKTYTNFDRNTPIEGRLSLDQIDSFIKKYIRKNNVIMKDVFNHGKHITKWLWQHFFDRSLVSVVSRIERMEDVKLSSCICYQKYLPEIRRIAAETPNLLPLLSEIPLKLWSVPDLFSFRYWAGEKPYINRLIKTQKYRKISKLSQKSHWRWLKRQSPLVVREWSWSGCDLSPLVQHGINEKIPVCVIRLIIRYRNMFACYAEYQTTVVRLFILHSLTLWKQQGIKFLRRYLNNELHNQLYQLKDYWENEGYRRRGIPISWSRFLAYSEAWHEQILIEQRRATDKEHKRLIKSRWNTPVQNHTIDDDIVFTALVTGKSLFEEGQRMHHCIFNYTQQCIDKHYLVFSTQYYDYEQSGNEPEQKINYATLGLVLDGHSKKWRVEQHWGPCNSLIPQKIQLAGQKLCELINRRSRA